jgi:hypothetical protein
MVRGKAHRRGAVGGGGGFTPGGVGVPPTVGRGQEAREGEVVLVAFLRRRVRGGKRKGRVTSVMPFIGVVGSWGRGSRVESAWKRDGWREVGGGASTAVGGQHRFVADGRGRVACARPTPKQGKVGADRWAPATVPCDISLIIF